MNEKTYPSALGQDSPDRQRKHIVCLDAINGLSATVRHLESLTDEFLGAAEEEKDKVSEQETYPALVSFLCSTPDNINHLSSRVQKCIDLLRDNLF